MDATHHVIDGYLTINYCKNDRNDHAHFLTHIETGVSCDDLAKIISMDAPTIYTSAVNAFILRNYFKCTRHITIVEFGKTYQIYTAQKTFFIFTCIRSFYNCGSMVLIARGNFGTLIYTGNSSINFDSLMSVKIIREIMQSQSLTQLYLDCSFNKIPGIITPLDKFKHTTLHFFKGRPNHFYIHVPIFGLEDILAQIADGLNEKMVVDEKRMTLIQFLGLTENFTLDKTEGRLHIISEGIMKRKGDVLTSQLVIMKVATEFTEFKSSYMNNGKIHFFTLFPHASDKECSEIVLRMKPKEFIPINSQSSSIRKSNISSADIYSLSDEELDENDVAITSSSQPLSEINNQFRDLVVKSVADSNEGTSRSKTVSKYVIVNEREDSSNCSEGNEKSSEIAKSSNNSLNSSKPVKSGRNLIIKDVKKQNGISKLRQKYSNVNVVSIKKQYAHTNANTTKMMHGVVRKTTLEKSGPLSSLEMKNQGGFKQDDSPSTSSDVQNFKTDNNSIVIESDDDSDSLISEKNDDVIDKEIEDNVTATKPQYNVLDEHTYARRISSKAVNNDTENRKRQSIFSVVDDNEASSRCEGENHLINDASTEEETDSDSESDSSSNSSALTEEGESNNTANNCEESTKSVDQVENDDSSSDDCIIQDNTPDIIELSDSSNDSFELSKTKEPKEQSRQSPSFETVNKLILSPKSLNNGKVCNSSMVDNFGPNKSRLSLMKSNNFSKETSSSTSASVGTPIMIKRVCDNSPKILPSSSVQMSFNRPVKAISSNIVNSNSLKTQIVYLNSSNAVKSIKSLFLNVPTQPGTSSSLCPEAVTPSTSNALHYQNLTGFKLRAFNTKQYPPAKGNTSIQMHQKFERVVHSAFKTNNPISSDVLPVEPNLPKTSEGNHLPMSSKGLSRDPIIPLSDDDDDDDNNHSNSDSNGNSEILAELEELIPSKSVDCSSNKIDSQSLEILNVNENNFPSFKSNNQVVPGSIKIKSLSELVADPSHLKTVNREPLACEDVVCKTSHSETSNVSKTLSSGDIYLDHGDKVLCNDDGMNNNDCKISELACSKSNVNFNDSSNANVCSMKFAPEIETPDSPVSKESKTVSTICDTTSSMISSQKPKRIRKRKPKPKKSIWIKLSNRSRRRKWRLRMAGLANNPIEQTCDMDLSEKPVNSTDNQNSSPKVYPNFYEFFATYNLRKADCRLLNQFNISESYVKIIPHFKDTFYKYDSVKKCYILSENKMNMDVTIRENIFNQDINYSSENHKRKLDETLTTTSDVSPRCSKRLKNFSHQIQSTEKSESDGVIRKLYKEARMKRRRHLLMQNEANSKILSKGYSRRSKKKTNDTCTPKQIVHGEYKCYISEVGREKLIAQAVNVKLIGNVYKCPICDYSTRWKKDVKRHTIAVHVRRKPYTCVECCNKTEKMSCDNSVKQMEKPNVKRVPNSNICNSGIVNCKCSQCKNNCDNDNNLHMKHIHPESIGGDEANRTGCYSELENETFEMESSDEESLSLLDSNEKKDKLLNADEAVEFGDNVYKCPNCEYTSNCKGKVTQHIASIHVLNATFKCPGCSYQGKDKSSLLSHITLIHMK